ncbi:hypothetical protein N7495_002780 [Penicillium taxi]|uniref:uncharacterized protein n=1 Tax=Penicillium taxi TaxID=168475 RepID=UPI00254598C9|nr:uncharacterized protein N7495_002780 [Penicillium taxi]KAJ5902252.1 hypothetical protein N7495_002780 [Penicillium taxi]
MSGNIEQASDIRKPPPFGRQSSAPSYSQSQDSAHRSSSFEVPLVAPYYPPVFSFCSDFESSRSVAPILHADDPSGKRSGRESPNPDDYYRSEGLVVLAPNVTVANDNMATGDAGLDAQMSPLPPTVVELSQQRRPAFRSISDSPTLGGPPILVPATRSTPRARQSSFKDLINKFNNTSDEVIPLPTVISKTPSQSVTSLGVTDDIKRSRDLPRPRAQRDSLPSITVNQSQGHECVESTPDSPIEQQQTPEPLNVIPPLFQQSPTSFSRRPLLLESLAIDTQVKTLGIPTHLRRRGSDGSIQSPNTATSIDQFNTPLTPTAWYLGQANSLEAVHAGAGLTASHRRTQSERTKNPLGLSLAEPWDPQMAVSAPLHMGKPIDEFETPGSPNSRSRIPISSHRLSAASGSEGLSPTNNNLPFSVRSSSIHLPPKGSSRLPKPSVKDSTTILAKEAPLTARGTGTRRNQAPDRLLQAYITTTPPKKSPPLRSSRPRQPVSSPASSQSKASDRVSPFQKTIDRLAEPRYPRPRQRRLPELGSVDFETRRQNIQQAFNRTVQENERKEAAAESRRRTQEREAAQAEAQAKSQVDEHNTSSTPITSSLPPQESREMAITLIEPAELVNENQTETFPLHLDTPKATMDSPTLGLPDANNHAPTLTIDLKSLKADDTPPSPVSEAASDGTQATTFDPEPQAGSIHRRNSESHRTLLNHIMQIRDNSSGSESCDDDEPDCSMSETDDKESIHNMTRRSSYLRESNNTGTEEPQQRQSQDPDHRWSSSSWSSSLHHQASTCDEQCDDSSDDIVLQMPMPGQETEPVTESCSAISTRPESLAYSDPDAPIQDLGLMGPETLGASPPVSLNMFSTPPSLARQGRWDSRRITQLYLEELTRTSGSRVSLPENILSRSAKKIDHDVRATAQTNSLTDEPVIVPRFQEQQPVADRVPHTSSLSQRDDWEHASPSIMDWMQVAAEDEAITPSTDKLSNMHDVPTPRVRRPVSQFNRISKPDSGLGLNIINSRGSTESSHPMKELQIEPVKVDVQPYDPYQVVPNRLQSSNGVYSTGGSGESSFRPLDSTHSFQTYQTADSSTTSFAPTESPMRMESRKSPSPEQRRLKKRRNVIKELVDTEYTFGHDMKVVDDIYKGTSGSCLDLSAEDVKILFANSDQVVQFSQSFQDSLKKASKSVYVMPRSQRWSSKRSTRASRPTSAVSPDVSKSDLEKDRATFVGEAFLAHVVQMEKVYSDYLKNHEAANKKLQILQSSPKVAIWLKECRDWASDLTSAWDLDSLLVKPVQRILKYPLLLSQLLDATPKDHPDYANIAEALQEVTSISVRINEMKRRADLVGQVVGRKRNQSDVRTGLSKAFGRRTEKLRQQVGLSDMFEDQIYNSLSHKFGDGFFQLQVVMRDVEMYTREMQGAMDQFNEFISSIEGIIDVSSSNYADLEGKWRNFSISCQAITSTALPEHLEVVRTSVIQPMVTLLKLHDGPQRVMKKRDKRLLDYARYKAVIDRGDRPDKKTQEQGEQFIALNETLKDELPRLYALTAKLMEAALKNFVEIQTTWWNILQKKLSVHIEAFPDDIEKIIRDWNSDYTFSDAQVLSLGICNGALLADTVNLVNFNTPPGRPSTMNSSSSIHRPNSMSDESAKVSYESAGSHFYSPQLDGSSHSMLRRRADSSVSGGPETPDIARSQLLQQVTNPASYPQAIKRADSEPFPSLPALSLDTPLLTEIMNARSPNENISPPSPGGRYTGFFSSAMPMSDEPSEPELEASHVLDAQSSKEPSILFLAASIYEFNIDRARREAGYPYLTYVPGEIFDIIAEKGELWLARNQDDDSKLVGWIWSKHFAKLSS